jgi:hypothetical protein
LSNVSSGRFALAGVLACEDARLTKSAFGQYIPPLPLPRDFQPLQHPEFSLKE